MSTDPFNSPASGGSFNNNDHLEELLLITPTEYVKEMKTTAGVTDAIRATVVTINEDDPAMSTVFDDALLFGKVLNGQTRPFIGKGLVLGRLTKGEAQPGKNAPWVLADATDDEKAKARTYLASTAPTI